MQYHKFLPGTESFPDKCVSVLDGKDAVCFQAESEHYDLTDELYARKAHIVARMRAQLNLDLARVSDAVEYVSQNLVDPQTSLEAHEISTFRAYLAESLIEREFLTQFLFRLK